MPLFEYQPSRDTSQNPRSIVFPGNLPFRPCCCDNSCLNLSGNFFRRVLIGFLLLGFQVLVMAQTVRYGYDSLGRLTHVDFPNGTSLDYVYDALGNRLVKATTIVGSPSNQPPSAVTNPSIPNGTTNITLTPNLSWTAATDPNAADVVAYYVYFGTSPPPPLAFSGWTTNWSPGQLLGLTTYYWYVVARDSHNA